MFICVYVCSLTGPYCWELEGWLTRPAMEVMELAENKEKVHFQLLGENYSEPSMRYF